MKLQYALEASPCVYFYSSEVSLEENNNRSINVIIMDKGHNGTIELRK